jgi:hypothetical protein
MMETGIKFMMHFFKKFRIIILLSRFSVIIAG